MSKRPIVGGPDEACKKLQNLDTIWDFLSPEERNMILQEFVHRVWLSKVLQGGPTEGNFNLLVWREFPSVFIKIVYK
ncbi:MAG: hypothetical protein LBJ89_04720 [Holosporales bacterium]|jgi:hypothetical protein|nr:hypothetical protein [Holosporales bacterium]